MAKKNTSNKTKVSTDDLIDSAIAQQNDWMENRRAFARRFLHTLNIFARPAPEKKVADNHSENRVSDNGDMKNTQRGLRAYWFPIFCALVVIFIAIWVAFIHSCPVQRVVVAPNVPEPVVRTVDAETVPSFDIVRIERGGTIVVAGRWIASNSVSIEIDGKIVATEQTDRNGEFVYAPIKPLVAGNYTIALIGVNPETRSKDKVFIFISEHGHENSISLLMTRDGSTLLQGPTMLYKDDLVVSKIDYLDTGRIVVTGDALPRLRVSLALDDKYIGFARVSDHRHFGVGADVGQLKPGKEYNLAVRLHDGDGRTVATMNHNFVMPEMTGDDDTFYTVRRGDCLWIIARNFLRRGVLFTMIAERNNITNTDLIFPQQVLEIPVGASK